METKLAAKRRQETGKNEMNRLRRTGDVPGNMIYEGNSIMISFAKTSIQKMVQSGLRQSTVIDLEIDGTQSNKVIVKEMQRHPVTGDIVHVDFYRLTQGRKLTVSIPVRSFGTAIGIKNGGAMEQFYQSVKIRTTPEKLRETIDVDVTSLDVGDGVRLSQLPVEKEWDIRLAGDPMILKVSRSRMTVEGPEGAPGAAAAAEGAAAPAAEKAAKAPEKK